MDKKIYTLLELAKFLSADFRGDPSCLIGGIGALNNAQPGQISFLHDSKYTKYLQTTKASAVILKLEDFNEQYLGNFILVKDPYLAYAKISGFFKDAPEIVPEIHPTVLIGKNCKIGNNVGIGPYCVVGDGVTIGDEVRIDAGCKISDGVIVGAGSKLFAHVTLYHKIKLGDRVTLHAGVVIGSDGFGNANERGVWHKIHQLGTVVIGNDVEIGSNTTVDRGTIEDTIIEDGVRIDNQVQIGHNVRIGANTAIAGCVGIAGSTKIGRYCMIGGGVGMNGHIEIADRVIITGGSNVGKSISEPGGIYASAVPAMPHRAWWRILARLVQLEKIINRLQAVEKKLI